jgi:hypothetical protein
MKNAWFVIGLFGVFMFLYSLGGAFIDRPTIGLTFADVRAATGLTIANSIMLVAVLVKLWQSR